MGAMQELVKNHAARALWPEQVSMPGVGINDILIKALRTALCRTDLDFYIWHTQAEEIIPAVSGSTGSALCLLLGRGYRDSTQSWHEVLLESQAPGAVVANLKL